VLDRATVSQPTYIVSNSYMDAIEYMHAKDLSPLDVKYVSCPEVLAGTTKPRVIVLGEADQVPQGIIDVLIRREAEVTYESIH
jgi:hypothetical protein